MAKVTNSSPAWIPFY